MKMTRKEFSTTVVERRLELIKTVLQSKGTEYGADITAFHNFEEAIGFSLHNKPSSTAWEFMVKHLVSIKDIITAYEKEGKLPTEAILQEKIGDAINYLILIEGLFKQEIITKSEILSQSKLVYNYCDHE